MVAGASIAAPLKNQPQVTWFCFKRCALGNVIIADRVKISKHCVLKVLCSSAIVSQASISVAFPSWSKMEGCCCGAGGRGQSRGAVPSKADVAP